jgi:hypothetical protein
MCDEPLALTLYEFRFLEGLKHFIAMGADEVADNIAELFLCKAPPERFRQRVHALLLSVGKAQGKAKPLQ